MSHIPNNAMPHAQSESGEAQSERGRAFSQLGDRIRDNPKTAIAAGAAVAAGVAGVTAATMYARHRSNGRGKSDGSKKS